MTTYPFLPRVARMFSLPATLFCLAVFAAAVPAEIRTPDSEAIASTPDGTIPAYKARFGRQRPLIAIVGENSGTELTDFVIPYGVLAASGAADVVTVATQPGVLHMRPALTVQPHDTIGGFDTRFPDGADYVIVPAVMKYNDPTLLAWVKAQGAKGSTLVSICDGAAVLAATGLMDGHRATAHWASEKFRRTHFPSVRWVANLRYVADGKIVSTAGISAAMPASLALVEAIAGRDRALALATELGVSEWSTAHNTAPFRPRFGVNLRALIAVNYTNGWFHSTDMIGLPIVAGVDEIALAVTADAYSRTGRSMIHALAESTEPVRTRNGLMVIADTLTVGGHHMDRMLPELDATPSGQWLAKSIDGINRLYGYNTAYGVALDFELPMFPQPPRDRRRQDFREMKLSRRIVLLAYEDMNLLDLAGPMQAFATASRYAEAQNFGLYELIVASAGGGLVTSSSGLAVMTLPLAKLKGVAIDTIVTAGGCRGQSYYASPELVKWIKRRAPSVRRVCSVCTGAFLLAAAGQLDGRRVATHWEWVARLRTLHPKIHVDANRLFIQDGPIWTSAGVTAGIDLTLALIEEDFGHRVAIETARQLVMFIKRSGGQSQFSVPLEAQSGQSEKFADLHAWAAGNLNGDLRVERLAEQAGMSPRTFARVYTAKSGRTPAKMVEAMRLEAACRALEETSLPLKTIAASTGYAEEQNLRRVFLRKLGVTPSQYRHRFSTHASSARKALAPLARKKRNSTR